MENRKLILYISMSVDGFIATNDDDISWLSLVEKEGEDYGYYQFADTIDTYIVGKKTYDVVRSLCGGVFPLSEKYKCYVITRTEKESENGVTFYTGDLEKLIDQLKNKEGKSIYCDGGGQIVKLLMERNIIDEYIISVIPIILGNGKRLFLGGTEKIELEALPSKYFDTGLVQLHYKKRISNEI